MRSFFPRSITVLILVMAWGINPLWSAESPAKISTLIKQLGSEDYFARQRAYQELSRLGLDAFDALQEATTNDDLEIATQAKSLSQMICQQQIFTGDLQGYENLDTESRLLRMRQLREMPDYKGVPALCRLVQFEPSPVFSKIAAVELLNCTRTGKPPSEKLVALLRQHLESSPRPGAHWLMIFARYCENPSLAIADWEKATTAEENVLRVSPRQTDPRIVDAMTRTQADWQRKQGRKDEALATMRRLIELEKGDPTSLLNLAEWLIDQKAWEAMNELAQKFAGPFATSQLLLYAQAQSQAEQGDRSGAEATAQRAWKLHLGPQSEELRLRIQVAMHLCRRGLFDWSEREYRYVIEHGTALELAAYAQIQLSEMLHDQQQDLRAAEVLADCDRSLGKERNANATVVDRTLKEIRPRMHYFYACHWQAQGDPAKYRQSLDAAIAVNPTDVDVLIAAYHITDATPEYHRKICDLIRKAADELREQLNDDDDGNFMNQFAWLIGNTEGDYDEAVKYSLLSLQKSPGSGGYYDTLAHVYYTKGDYQNAVKYQTRAAELEPHAGLIRRALEMFQKKLPQNPGED